MSKGSCLCGVVRYQIRALAGPIVHCHCITCQKAHSAPGNTTAGVKREDFQWLADEEVLRFF